MSSDPITPSARVEVITSVQCRRRWSTAEKVRLVEKAMQPGSSVPFVARRYGISPSLLFTWKRRMQEGGQQAVQADEDVVGTSRVRELERRVRPGAPARAQDDGSGDPAGSARPRTGRKTDVAAAVPEDAALLPTIRRIVDERPTYGYRRITALVNRALRAEGEPVVNAKRVLRIMRPNGLTLERHTALRPGRTHDGVVVALRSNVRWCSDHLELHPRDGSVVRVLFAIDARDREVIAWSATTAGVSGEMVRDLMVACVERRFGGDAHPARS